MQRITPFLWFDHQAGEAAQFYVSIFKNSKAGRMARYDESGAKASGRPAGSMMTVAFKLDGQEFVALNGGPIFQFTEAISTVVFGSLAQHGVPGGRCPTLPISTRHETLRALTYEIFA